MKQPGEPAQLYYDLPLDDTPVEGDVVETSTGRRYLIVELRAVKSLHRRARGECRWMLQTVVMEPSAPVPADATVWPLHWYRR